MEPLYTSFVRALLTLAMLLITLVSIQPRASAQAITADLLGTVTDLSGAAVSNASVTATNKGTQAKRTVASSGTGEYVFSLLPAGTYDLTVSAAGFESYTVTGIRLESGDRLRAQAVLKIGASTESIQVTADATPLQTDTSTVASTINEKATQDLPLNGRNFVNLVQVQVGVNAGPPNSVSSGNRPDDRRQSSSVSANGQQELLNNYILDGLDNNDRFEGLIAVRPSIDAIREITVNTNLYTAELGRTAGAVVDILTRSGTNRVHGTAYEFFRNNITDARNFFATSSPELRQNQFGGSVGGPILKNRMFIFGDYEGFRQVDATASVFISTVPTLFEEQNPGNFSDTGGPIVTKPLDPTGLAYFKLYPAPNRAVGTNPNANNFLYNPARRQDQNTFDLRVDQVLNASNSLFERYSFANTDTTTPGELPSVNGVQPGGTFAGNFPGSAKQRAQNLDLDYTHIFTPSLLMELRAGYTRLKVDSLPLNYGNNLNDAAPYAIPNANAGLNDSGLAPFSIPGYAALGDAIFTPILVRENTFQYGGAVTYNRGPHTFKAGANLIRRQATDFQSPFPKGLFIFALGGIESELTGGPYIYLRQNLLVEPQYRLWEPSTFVQDDWRVNKKLTLNLGIRYEVFPPNTEKHGNIANLNLASGTLVVGGTGGVQTRYGDVAPRLGFAATVTPKTVVRGGFGISYFPTDVQNAITLINPPYSYASGTQVVFGKPLSAGVAAPIPSSLNALTGSLAQKTFNYHTGSLQQFNLFVQHDFSSNVVSVGYVGDVGRHLSQQIPNIDLPAPNGNTAGVANPQLPAPYAALLPNVNTIESYTDGGISSYHSLQATYERRSTSGATINANYTLAHGFDDILDGGSGNTEAYGLEPTNIRNYDYSNSSVDVRQRFAITANYDLPVGKNSTGFEKLLEKGWQLNSLAFWQTGLPFTITNATANINLPTVTVDRPNVIGNPNLSTKSLDAFFNISDFVAQPAGTAGDVRRNALYGPHQRRVDLSAFKTIDITESLKFQLRAECFNISNTPNFLNPNSQISATANGVATNGGGFGSITQTNPGIAARQFQFAAKILF